MSAVKRYRPFHGMDAVAIAFMPDVVVAATDYDALAAEVERLRKDAERLRWVMLHLPGSAARYMGVVWSDGSRIESVRAAIDAAMTQETRDDN